MGLAPLRGCLGRGRVPTPEEEWERPSGGQNIRRKCGQHFPCPLGIQGACCGLGPDPLLTEAPSRHVNPEGKRVGRKSKGQTEGPSVPGGWLGGVEGSHTQCGSPTVRGSKEMGETLRRVQEWEGVWPAFPLPTWAQRSLLQCQV